MVAPEPCRVIKRDPTEGFTQDKKERIESVGRYKGGTLKPEDNRYHWREIYRILFPEVAPEDIPSPCKFALLSYYYAISGILTMVLT